MKVEELGEVMGMEGEIMEMKGNEGGVGKGREK